MPTPGDVVAVVSQQPASPATNYRHAADAIRRCLALGDVALEHGSPDRASEYLLGILDDLGPTLSNLRSALRR